MVDTPSTNDSKEVSPRSSIFVDTNEEVLNLIDAGEIDTHEKYRAFIEGKGFDYDEFHEAVDEYKSDKGQLAGQAWEKGEGGVGALGRVAGQTWGAVGKGFQHAFPETAEKLKPIIAKAVGGEEARQELFFPHATGLEEFAGDITAYALTAIPVVRGVKYGAKGIGLVRAADRLKKGAATLKKTGSGTALAGGWAVGATAIEKPEDNIVNVLSSSFGDQEVKLPLPFTDKAIPLSAGKTVDELIGDLKVNPDDPKAVKYLRAFMNNVIAEGVLLGAPLGILKGAQQLSDTQLSRAIGKANKYRIEHMPTPLKDIADGTRRLGSKYFTSRFGLNDEGMGYLVERVGSQKAALTRAAKMSEELEDALKREVPSILRASYKGPVLKKDEKTTEFLETVINEALAGSDEALAKLRNFYKATDSADLIVGMRDEIDSMSKYVEKHIAKGKLKAVVGENLGTYLNRSYRIFDDPDYMKNIPEEVQLAARKYFSNTLKIADEDMGAVMDYYMGGLTKQEKNTFLKGLKGGREGRTSQILRSRQEIAPEIRALWGEVKDPQKNFVNTYRKLANVISEYKFRDQIADAALRAGKATRETTGVADLAKTERKIALEALKKQRKLTSAEAVELGNITRSLKNAKKVLPVGEVAEEGVERASEGLVTLGGAVQASIKDPLKGLFVDEAWKKAIDDGMEITLGKGGANNVVSHWMKLKSLSQAQKTVFSIPTHGRNVMGNMFLMLANGTIDPRFAYQGGADTLRRLIPVGGFRLSKEGTERLARYQKLGVVDSAVHVGSLEAAARDALKSGNNLNDWIGKSLDKSMLTRGAKKLADKTVRLYEAEDNLFKIWNFEQMKSAYKKAMPNMSDDALERFVAERARDVMPNYNLVPKFYKGLRYAPIGNFMAFPLEMIRNSKNIAKYAWKDFSGQTARELGITDPDMIRKLRNLGLKRGAGMTAAVVAGDAAVEQSKQLFGISDEQEKAFNKTLPSWARNTNKIFLSPIKKNKDGKIAVDYLNLGPIDPFSYWKTPTKQIIAAMMNDQEYNEAEVDQLYNDAMWNAISPFVDPSMLTQAGLDIAAGKTIDPKASGAQQIMQGLGALARSAFVPSTYDFFERKAQYNKTQEKLGKGVTQYGYAISEGEVDLPAFLGFKRQKVDLSQGFEWNLGSDLKRMREADSDFRNTFRDYSITDPQEVIDAYMKATKAKYKYSQKLRGKLDGYRALGMDEDSWYRALSKDGLGPDKDSTFDELLFVDNNKFEPPPIPDVSLGPLAEVETKVPVPYDDLYKLYNRYKGLPIEFEEEEE